MVQMSNAFERVEILSDAEYFIKWIKHSSDNPERYQTVEVHIKVQFSSKLIAFSKDNKSYATNHYNNPSVFHFMSSFYKFY